MRYGEGVTVGGVTVTFHPAGHVLGSAQIAVEADGLRIVASGDYKNVADPTCVAFELVRCDVFITEATFALPVFRHGDPDGEIAKLLRSVAVFPGSRSSGWRLFARQGAAASSRCRARPGYDTPIYLHGGMERSRAITPAAASHSANCGWYAARRQGERWPAPSRSARRRRSTICGRGGFRDPRRCVRVRLDAGARAGAAAGRSLPLVISDHADWDGLAANVAATGAGEIWVTHGQEDALVHWCGTHGLKARPLDIVGYGDEDEPGEQSAGEAGG